MITIPGYQIHENIYESGHSLVYRALRDADDQPVIIKVLQQEYPSLQELVRYRQEYEMTSTLEVEGVIRAYSLEHFQHTFAIIFEDFGGEIVLSKLLEKMMWIVVENAGVERCKDLLLV